MSVKEEFENFYQKLKQLHSFENIDDRLKFEALITQANFLNEILQNPSDEYLAKIKVWMDDNKEKIEYFINL